MDDMQSMWGIIGVIVFFCGIYALYAFIMLKKNGEINATLLLGKDYLYKKCKDKENYTRKAGPALLIFGIVSAAYGVLDIIHCYVYPMALVDTVGMCIFFIVLVWFAVYTTKLKRMYF
ncbi:MAG TPA: hypothetical protein H9909_15030 [Candidatus Mediterraneibacter norfolkensis]|nr:hypothetical protein [Candidatus Mediterraneibacter norfolkensis]